MKIWISCKSASEAEMVDDIGSLAQSLGASLWADHYNFNRK
jgi:hypothetical protein